MPRWNIHQIIGLGAVILPLAALAAPASLCVEPGDIAQRPAAPEFAFERFSQTRAITGLQFSADNRSIYFLDNDGHVNNVFAMNLAASAVRQVTHFAEPVSEFMVGHRGDFLIVVKDVAGNENHDLYRFDLASGKQTRLTDAGHGDTSMLCGLSPDDTRVYYAQTRDHRRQAGIWQVQSDGSNARELFPAGGRTLECDAVSPDGRHLIYGELLGFDTRHLGIVAIDSGETRSIGAVTGINHLDGSFYNGAVYFRSALNSDGFRLWRYRLDDGHTEPVPLPFARDVEALSVHAQGRVAVIRYRDGLTGKTAVFRDGFDTPLDFGLPPASLVGAVFSRGDPELGILFTETATEPPRYYRVDKGKDPALLYDSNRSGIASEHLAQSRSLLIPGFDGLRIPVHLFIPNGTSARHQRPAIVLVHGGPDEHIDPLYLSNIQFLANRGFVVVVPNVRGSTGFGKHFASLDDGDWGGTHIDDIVAVTDAIRTLDFIDSDNLLLAGASFGGFSVMSVLVRYPDSFRAAVNLFGFTELATFVDSWPRYLQRHLSSALGFDPRRDRRRNWLLSPIYHVDRITVPLQIHQGANDSRVPRVQSDWLVQRLRELGRKVEYFVYEDEGHGFTRLDNERDAYERMIGFFRRHGG
jgi:dipeptidyl aminopeptidase/acylaminoacyl peptidase